MKAQYEKKKKEIVHSKVEKEINHIFQNLPENYEIYPEINNKLELFMKNIDDIKYVLNKKRQKIWKKWNVCVYIILILKNKFCL